MLKIGEFSKLAMVTVKALRFYDDEGLLKPLHVDKWTGYRYYGSEQLYEIQKIIALRQAGLTIEEIKSVVSGNDAEEILLTRQRALEAESQSINEKLLRIKKLICNLKEKTIMKFQATIKEIGECNVFYGIGKLHLFDELNEFIPNLGAECAAANPDVKCLTPDYCFVSYLDDEFTPVDFTVMYAEAVDRLGKDTENVKFKTMPAITALSVVVKGDYNENLGMAYAYAMEWIKDNGYKITGKARERYIDGCWNKENPCDYLTEIQIPVENISK